MLTPPTTYCINLSTRLKGLRTVVSQKPNPNCLQLTYWKVMAALCMPFRHLGEGGGGDKATAPVGVSPLHARLTYSDLEIFGKKTWTPQLSIKVNLYAKAFHQRMNGHVLRISWMHHYYSYTTAKDGTTCYNVTRAHENCIQMFIPLKNLQNTLKQCQIN
jgi:hypothetical protein